MKINIFPIVSSLHGKEKINSTTQELLNELSSRLGYEFSLSEVDNLYDGDLSLILIQSGGSEQLFLENFSKLKPPYYLLTYGHNNSLAASLEILSYLKDNNLAGEVLHGTTEYLANRIKQLLTVKKAYRYGVIGKPSDWLIASRVDYMDAVKHHGVELVDIDINEVISLYNEFLGEEYDNDYNFDKKALNDSLRLTKALEIIKDKYQLNGLTIRCFDLLDSIKTTACLALALFNKDKIVSTCEGDIPTMLSMNLLKEVFNQAGFQANPSRIDIMGKNMVLAHCTLPLDMVKSYSLDTHFESGIGVAVRGKLFEGKITIFKLSKNLKDYFVTTGRIVRNLDEDNLCRTQIYIDVDDNIEYFLTRPYGNHHVVVYGDYKEELISYMKSIL